MTFINRTGLKTLLALLASSALASTAQAQAIGATLTYGPAGSAGVPTLGGSALIALAVLLAVVAVRFLRERRASARLMSLLLLACSLAVGIGGISVVSDSFASIPLEMTNADGGVINVPEGRSDILNGTDKDQVIKQIVLESGCAIVDDRNGGTSMNGGLNGGGSFVGACAVSTALAPADYCSIFIDCDL